MVALKLASINIERSKHLELVEAFLDAHRPDVVCMQEVCERDFPRLLAKAGGHGIFAPLCPHPADEPEEGTVIIGAAIYSRTPFESQEVSYYVGSEERARTGFPRSNPSDRPLLTADVRIGSEFFRILTTHFTWTPDGAASDAQRADMQALLSLLSQKNEFVLAGDFNAPRIYNGEPGEIFSMLAANYTDNIPQEYGTSIDGDLHRAGPLPYMVDGVFSTPGYSVSDVTLHAGVSDHCAVTAMVRRVSGSSSEGI